MRFGDERVPSCFNVFFEQVKLESWSIISSWTTIQDKPLLHNGDILFERNGAAKVMQSLEIMQSGILLSASPRTITDVQHMSTFLSRVSQSHH